MLRMRISRSSSFAPIAIPRSATVLMILLLRRAAPRRLARGAPRIPGLRKVHTRDGGVRHFRDERDRAAAVFIRMEQRESLALRALRSYYYVTAKDGTSRERVKLCEQVIRTQCNNGTYTAIHSLSPL